MRVNRHRHVTAAAGLAALGLASLTLPAPVLAQWTVQPLSTSGNAGWTISTAMDYGGGIHVGYFSTAADQFADRNGASWVSRPGITAGDFSLAMSRRNQVGLAARQYVNPNQLANFGERDPGSATWNLATLASGTFADSISLAYDAANRPHVAYVDTSTLSLKYARWTGAAWSIQTVASDPGSGQSFYYGNSLADITLDGQGNPYFTWYNFSADREVFAKPNGSGGWTASNITTAPGYSRVVFDQNDVAHVAMPNRNNGAISYLTYNGTSWSSQFVGQGGFASDAKLVFDAANSPHIAYSLATGASVSLPPDGVMYARLQNGSWVNQQVGSWASSTSGPEECDLQVDRRGGVHVIYSDDSEKVYAAYKPGASGGVTKPIAASVDARAYKTGGGSFVVSDGQTLLNQYRSATDDERTILEFNLASVPAGQTLYSAQLQLDISGYAGGGGTFSSIDLWGYAGDGGAAVADATQITHLDGWTGQITKTGLLTIDLDAAHLQQLRAGGDYIGIVATAGLDLYQSGFVSTEAAALGSGSPPTLLLTYAPEPASGSLLLSSVGWLCLRRRRGSVAA